MLARDVAERVLARALSTGADYAEIYLEDAFSGSMRMLDGKVDEISSGREHGAGVRVFKGLTAAYAYSCDTSEQGLLLTAYKAALAVGDAGNDKPVSLPEMTYAKNISPIAIDPETVPHARKIELLRAATFGAKDCGEKISQVLAAVAQVKKKVFIANTDGQFVADDRCRVRLTVMAVAADGSENQTGFAGPGAQRGFEFFESIDPYALGCKSAKTALTMLTAPYCPAKRMPVAIDNGFGGVLFHEACGHSLEATSVAKGSSEFCGKLNQRIASPIVSAMDDATIPNAWGSVNVDDEGNPGRKKLLIENGILKGYMIDKLGGRRMDMAATGSGRRQNYKYAPTSRMSNTFILPGQDSDEGIISSIAYGLYCKQMGGGSVNPGTGEFNFAVAEGYIVKNGKIDRPARGATLIGKGGDVLMRIDRVGKNLDSAQGVCGSASGSVPTNVGQPMIRVSELTVGGREGADE